MHDVITVGLPLLAILFGILLNQRGVERLDARMDRFEGRIADLDGRMDRMQADLDGRMDRMQSDLNGRMDRMQSDLNGRMDRMQADLSRFYEILGEHSGKIEILTKK